MNALNSLRSDSRAKCHECISLRLSKYDYEGSFQPATFQPLSTKKKEGDKGPLSTPRGGKKNGGIWGYVNVSFELFFLDFLGIKKQSYIL